jgi:hypothetical protein
MRRYLLALLLPALLTAPALLAQRGDFDNLLGKDLSQWESVGDGVWKLTPDGILLGHRPVTDASQAVIEGNSFAAWQSSQAWLYTKKEYGEYDLHLDYFVGAPGNSGVSIRDSSRGQFAVTLPPDAERTPGHVAYEIQINADWPDPWPTGSIYGLKRAKTGVEIRDAWNSLNNESRKSGIRVSVLRRARYRCAEGVYPRDRARLQQGRWARGPVRKSRRGRLHREDGGSR